MDNNFFLFKDIAKLRIERKEKNMDNIYLSKREIETLLKCIEWVPDSKEIPSSSLDSLREKLKKVTDG